MEPPDGWSRPLDAARAMADNRGMEPAVSVLPSGSGSPNLGVPTLGPRRDNLGAEPEPEPELMYPGTAIYNYPGEIEPAAYIGEAGESRYMYFRRHASPAKNRPVSPDLDRTVVDPSDYGLPNPEPESPPPASAAALSVVPAPAADEPAPLHFLQRRSYAKRSSPTSCAICLAEGGRGPELLRGGVSTQAIPATSCFPGVCLIDHPWLQCGCREGGRLMHLNCAIDAAKTPGQGAMWWQCPTCTYSGETSQSPSICRFCVCVTYVLPGVGKQPWKQQLSVELARARASTLLEAEEAPRPGEEAPAPQRLGRRRGGGVSGGAADLMSTQVAIAEAMLSDMDVSHLPTEEPTADGGAI